MNEQQLQNTHKGNRDMRQLIENIFGFLFMAMAIPTFFVMVDESLPITALCVACLITLSFISFYSANEG